MEKVRIVALEQDKNNVVAALHKEKIIDLRKSKLEIGDDKPAAYSTEISDALIKVNGALQILGKREVRRERHIPLERLLDEVRGTKAVDRAYGLSNERKSLTEDMAALSNAERIGVAFADIKVDFSRLRSEYLGYRAFEADQKALNAFSKKADAKGRAEAWISRVGKKSFIFIAYDKKISIDEMIKDTGMVELDLTAKYLEGRPREMLAEIRSRKARNEKRLKGIEREMQQLGERYYSKMANLGEMLEIELARADASAMFKRTESTFVVEGWIEKRRFDSLNESVLRAAKGRAEVERIEHDELAPTHTNRPKILKPFEYMMNFYSVQRSDEIDPTWIFIISFPIFYGLMVSDVGYGIASLLFVTYISRKVNPEGLVYNACKIWQLMSIAAIFFGVISNQYFGFQLNQYVIPGATTFDWFKNATSIMGLTILFGIIQIVLGLAFGFINQYNKGHRKLAYSKISSIIVIVSGAIAVSALFGLTSGTLPIACAALAVVALLVTAAISGHEASEITNLITHPLSYARIMGFGLGSVIIAFLIDQYFTPSLAAGIPIFILYLIIFILLHFLNMILGIFEGIVQGVRLNFVEFFSKFYIGNGIKFRPFSLKRVYTKEDE